MNSPADGQRYASAAGEAFAPNLLDSLAEGCGVIDRDFRYVYVNDAGCLHARRAKTDLIGRTVMAAYPGIEQTPVFALLRRCMEERTPQRTDSEFELPDGSKRCFELRMEPVPDGVAILSVDVDEHRRAAEELRRLTLENTRMQAELEQIRARARAIHDHLPNATFLWQRQGDDFFLVDVNAAAAAVTRGRAREQLGKGTEGFEGAIGGLREDLVRCFETRDSTTREADCTLPGAAGPRKLALAYGFVPQDMVLLTTEDVTDRRRTQEQLWLSQRLEAVGRLAGGVAHDFNNLLSVILGCAEFALAAVDGPMQHDLEEIRKAGERAAILTRQLLAFSRRQVLQPEVTSLNRIVANLDGLLRRLIGEDVELRLELRSGVGNVRVDPGQIEQVIMNLAINSRDAMPKGGKLAIATSNVDLDEEYVAEHVGCRVGPYVMLSVSDTGSGMDEETKRHMFEPFFTTKEPGKGTGLGLATVYGIVKQSGGNIWVYSERGGGTTFKIYLPRERMVAEALRPIAQASLRPRGKETILLVEDDAAVRSVAQRILRSAGYTVLVASNGAEALGVCKRHAGEIQLVLTDVVMPDMSGRDLVELLTATRPGAAVLYASGYTDDAIVQHGVLEPGTNFLSKPFHAGVLTRKVREVLDRTCIERCGLGELARTGR